MFIARLVNIDKKSGNIDGKVIRWVLIEHSNQGQ